MNANKKLMIDFRVNGKHDHYINDPKERHTQPHQKKAVATKPYKLYHRRKENV